MNVKIKIKIGRLEVYQQDFSTNCENLEYFVLNFLFENRIVYTNDDFWTEDEILFLEPQRSIIVFCEKKDKYNGLYI